MSGRLLVDGDGRWAARAHIDVRFVHDAQELPGVGREALDVAALSFGVDGVESQRRFAGPRHSREDYEAIAWELNVDTLKVVLACTADGKCLQRQCLLSCKNGQPPPGWAVSGLHPGWAQACGLATKEYSNRYESAKLCVATREGRDPVRCGGVTALLSICM